MAQEIVLMPKIGITIRVEGKGRDSLEGDAASAFTFFFVSAMACEAVRDAGLQHREYGVFHNSNPFSRFKVAIMRNDVSCCCLKNATRLLDGVYSAPCMCQAAWIPDFWDVPKF